MKLFQILNQYVRESSWKTIALLKYCVFSLGAIVGMQLPKTWRKPALGGLSAIFIMTYIPLMAKFFKVWKKNK